jgi:hypothetical protein
VPVTALLRIDDARHPAIRDRFEFWFFSYETGNPIPYSALQLRRALEQAVAALDPAGKDAALRDMVIIGHSQGGLLAKMNAIDTGTRLWDQISTKPLDRLRLQPETRELLRQSLFLQPEPFVGRVVFVATPHRGSYLAEYSLAGFVAGLVRLPLNLLRATGDAVTNNPDTFRFDPKRTRFGSVYGMTPGSPLIMGLADIPVAPGIPAHSIIAMRGDGPVEGWQRRRRALPERAHRGRGVRADRALGAFRAGQPADRARGAPDPAAACRGGLPEKGHRLRRAPRSRERSAVRPLANLVWEVECAEVGAGRRFLHARDTVEREEALMKTRAMFAGVGMLIALPLAAQEMFFYPSQGQTQDRAECQVWAQQQTGVDPTRPAPQVAAAPAQQGQVVRGAARGGLLGVVGGAIGGDVGKGAAIGAGVGATKGLLDRRRDRIHAEQAQQQTLSAQQAGLTNFNRALDACMQGRGYSVS